MKRKYEFSLGIGLQGRQTDTFEYDEYDVAGMTEAEIEKMIEEDYIDWRNNYIDGWFSRVDGDE